MPRLHDYPNVLATGRDTENAQTCVVSRQFSGQSPADVFIVVLRYERDSTRGDIMESRLRAYKKQGTIESELHGYRAFDEKTPAYHFTMMVGNCDILITAPSPDAAPRVRNIVGDMDLTGLSRL